MYLYQTVIHITKESLGIEKDNNTFKQDFEDNYKDKATLVSTALLRTVDFIIELDYKNFVVKVPDWSLVNFTEDSRYTLYLISEKPI
jgi:hypothetical protein